MQMRCNERVAGGRGGRRYASCCFGSQSLGLILPPLRVISPGTSSTPASGRESKDVALEKGRNCVVRGAGCSSGQSDLWQQSGSEEREVGRPRGGARRCHKRRNQPLLSSGAARAFGPFTVRMLRPRIPPRSPNLAPRLGLGLLQPPLGHYGPHRVGGQVFEKRSDPGASAVSAATPALPGSSF